MCVSACLCVHFFISLYITHIIIDCYLQKKIVRELFSIANSVFASTDFAAVNMIFYCITLPCRYFYKVTKMWQRIKKHITPSNLFTHLWTMNANVLENTLSRDVKRLRGHVVRGCLFCSLLFTITSQFLPSPCFLCFLSAVSIPCYLVMSHRSGLSLSRRQSHRGQCLSNPLPAFCLSITDRKLRLHQRGKCYSRKCSCIRFSLRLPPITFPICKPTVI